MRHELQLRRGRTKATVDRNIRSFMAAGYSYPEAVRAAHALTGAQKAVVENPMDANNRILLTGGLLVAGAVGIALLFLSKKAAAAPSSSSASPTITPASGGQTLNVKVGTTIPIQLPAPATGYSWDGGIQGSDTAATYGSPQVAANGSVTGSLTATTAGTFQAAFAQIDSNGNPNPSTEVLVTIVAS